MECSHHQEAMLKEVELLKAQVLVLSNTEALDSIIKELQIRNGWTTIAEFTLAASFTRDLTHQIARINGSLEHLSEGIRSVVHN